MEVVRAFNNELSSLYEVKPPISKAKMTQITKCAIKGLKFYKHIVQSVEKFIQKCRPEYKVPGLYVIDSIVRQSRHQFGPDKDVFAPRFMKNIINTFQNLFKCADDDRPKIVRVLNLWQKNSVFPSDVIQPLLDMANPNSAGEWPYENAQTVPNDSPVRKSAPQPPANELTPNSKHKSAELSAWKGWPQESEEPATESHGYTEMSTKNVEKFTKANSSGVADNVIPTAKNVEVKTQEETVKFNKKLLDFDYGDEEDEEEIKTDDGQSSLAYSISQNLLSNPELLRQLQQMQQTIQQNESLKSELAMQSQPAAPKEIKEPYSPVVTESKPQPNPFLESQPPIPQPQPSVIPYPYDGGGITFPPPSSHMPLLPEQKLPMEVTYQHPMLAQEALLIQSSQVDEDDRVIYSMPGEPPLPPQDLDERALVIPTDDRIKKERSRSRSGSRTRGRSGRHRSRSRSPRRRKSRSRSRSRSRRNRSRSKDRDRERQKERERERERERDRRKKGIPPIKKSSLSVCSTTLWLGHVPKTLSEEDIANTFADFGSVLSIDMIPPRGCAYVVMDRRQDAHRALLKLKNLKLQGSSIKMAWAPGKGTKGKEFKDYWDADLGVTYIPFDKLPSDVDSLDALGEGGFIDEESLPSHLREMRQQREKAKHPIEEIQQPLVNEKPMEKNGMVSQATPMPPAMLPTTLGLPVVLPQMMQPQFGMPLPGLLPPQPMVVQHMQIPVGVPPPNPLMMVQPPSQNILTGTPLPVGTVPQMPHLSLPHPSIPTVTLSMSHMNSSLSTTSEPAKETMPITTLTASDATPTDEDGTSVSSPAVSIPTLPSSVITSSVPPATQEAVVQYTSAVGLHNPPRQNAPGIPVVSTSNSLPFPPPPHMGFGFPPPGLRPPPGQNIPVVSMNSAFPWQKSSAPTFGGFSEADMRFSAPPPSLTTLNTRPVVSQAGKITNAPPSVVNRPLISGNSAVTSKDIVNQGSLPGVNNKDTPHHMEQRNNDAYNNRHNMPHKAFSRSMSPGSYDIHEMDIDPVEEPRDIFPGNRDDFPRDDMGAIPRFPGPQDFHLGRGAMRGRWMHGPGNLPVPRFPRGMHMPPQFVPRGVGPRGAFPPRMEMEYFPPQGPPPPGPYSLNQRGHQPRRGGNNFPPPRGPDRFSNHGDFYEEPHFEEENRNRGYKPREDWGSRHDEWEEQNRWNEEDNNRPPPPPRYEKTELKEIKPIGKIQESSFKADQDEKDSKSSKSESPTRPEAKPAIDETKPKLKPKPKGRDLFHDMCRLQNYRQGRKGNSFLVKSVDKIKMAEKKAAPAVQKQETPPIDSPASKEIQREEKPKPIIEVVKVELSSTDTQGTKIVSELIETVPENRKRERDRKRSSRWGRTHSEEREFQQQKINEIEEKLQSEGKLPICEPAVADDVNVNCTTVIPDSDHVASASVVSSNDMFSENFSEITCSEVSETAPVQNRKTFVEVENVTEDVNSSTSLDVSQPSEDQTCVINSVSLETEEIKTTGPMDSVDPDVAL